MNLQECLKETKLVGNSSFQLEKKITSLDFSMYISTQLEEEKKTI